MKTKRIFAFLLCLVLALSLLPWEAVPVRAAGETEDNPYLVYDLDKLYDCLSLGGYIQLNNNVTRRKEYQALSVAKGKTVYLDLNGYTINGNYAGTQTTDPVINVSGALTLTDSRGGGKLTGGNNRTSGGGVYVTGGGSFTMAGGMITGNKAGADGGGVYVSDGGSFTMTGGTITGNKASNGGGV